MIIDHCHVAPENIMNHKKETHPTGTIQGLQEILKIVGADRAVTFAPFTIDECPGWCGEAVKQFGDPNLWLVEELKKHPNLFGFAVLNPNLFLSEKRLEKVVKMGLVGAKLGPIHNFMFNDPTIDDFYQMAEDLGITLHFHTGVHGDPGENLLRYCNPLLLDDVAQKHPDLPIIMAHIGGYAFFNEALAVLHHNKNCYAGLTTCTWKLEPEIGFPVGSTPGHIYYISPERVEILLKTVGADRIIWGADYPFNTVQFLKDSIEWVRSWDISDQDKEKILGGNIEKLLLATRKRHPI
jgi:predicted TIM-barrel fold metal-dependent hydrolase